MRSAEATLTAAHGRVAPLRAAAWLTAIGLLWTGGCKSWLDQSTVVRDRGDRLVVPILKSIDPIDEADTEFPGAEDVRPDDLKVIAADYVIGRNDLLSVSIFDLTAGGVESVRTVRVSETGMLSLPMLPEPIKAAGLTEPQLQKAIAQKYREADLLQNARVSVQVVEARQRTFNIMGAVNRPGQYVIVDSDFRILNALVQAMDVNANPEYLYVVRKVASEKPATRPASDGQPPATQPAVDPLAPRGESSRQHMPVLAASQDTRPAAPAPAPPDEKFILVEGKPMLIGATRPAAAPGAAPAVDSAAPAASEPVQPPYEFGAALKSDEDQRVIRVPLQALRNGDLRYNIVVRPNDVIIVPPPVAGFYYVGGHVGAPGAYNMTGQKINLKQAITAARMLDGLAVPAKTDVIRRVGDSELFVRVDLEKVFEGRQPDIYLKPNDVIVVGTDWYPPFLAAIRGAFRMTYGFGFLYDRNYAPAQKQRF